MRRFIGWSCALCLGLLSACDSKGRVTGPEAPLVFGSPGVSAANTLVVGTWTLRFTFVDDFGVPKSTETTWAFNADGSAVRSVITRSFLDGIADRQDSFARWTVQGDQVVIDFTAPFTGRVPLTFQRNGDLLILGGQTFVRAR